VNTIARRLRRPSSELICSELQCSIKCRSGNKVHAPLSRALTYFFMSGSSLKCVVTVHVLFPDRR